MKHSSFLSWLSIVACFTTAAFASDPIVDAELVFAESDGMLSVEAEHFFKQTETETRQWYLHSSREAVKIEPDGDPAHLAGASGGAYLEILPDTRRTHADKLIGGENFSNTPGKLAVLHYKVHFETAGKYYVWVRAYSTGSEDNGLHVGLDGEWPESGQRLQWCQGKNTWRWESKQRTAEEHCGVPYQIYLDIEEPGEHEIMFSMREDGFEFDKFLLTPEREFKRPSDAGPESKVHAGELPVAFASVKAPVATSPVAGQEPKMDKKDRPPAPRKPDGDGSIDVAGTAYANATTQLWHKLTLTMDGPFADEFDQEPNPFTDYALEATFRHAESGRDYVVPGYFAADGQAGESSATSGTQWRVHFVPDELGAWTYELRIKQGKDVALSGVGDLLAKYVGEGEFEVQPSDKQGRDFRAHGRLQYVGQHYLVFGDTNRPFIKAGPDAPETLLGYVDFDGTIGRKKNVPLKTWEPHVQDWQDGDPTWQDGKGKGLIGALNYLASKGCNTFSFLPYNAGGDGDNVWPFVERDDKMHYDCSKLDQWSIVFDHATQLGLHLHFKLQETEIDDNRRGHNSKAGSVPESLDGGKLGRERKLYCREMIARFGHALALNWNIGEENTQTPEEQRDMIGYLHDVDPYDHNIVIHTFPDQQDRVYPELLGGKSLLTGASLQNSWSAAHARTLKWREASADAGRPWVVCNDEQNPAGLGVPPDPGYQDHDGWAQPDKGAKYNLHDIRKRCLWGTLMAGGAGVEYYFGYKLPENDLVCQDFRSRDKSWDYCRFAVEFFTSNDLPLDSMRCLDMLLSGKQNYCFAKPGEVYVVYLSEGGKETLPVSNADQYVVKWFNPRTGESEEGELDVAASSLTLTAPDEEDWVALIRKQL